MVNINNDEEGLVKLLVKIQNKEAQINLLQETLSNNRLLQSKIISSIQPKMGITFKHEDLEEKKKKLMTKWRKDTLQIAIEEKQRELDECRLEFESKKTKYEEDHRENTEIYNRLEKESIRTTNRINKKMNKKLAFHQQQTITNTKKFTSSKKFERKKKQSKRRKKLNRINYKRKQKEKKQAAIDQILMKIRNENIVINLSNLDIPSSTILYLAKGLGFVKSNKVDKQDLKYDTLEFIRKVEWKAFFKDQPEQTPPTSPIIHQDLRVSSGKGPNIQNTLIDDIKTRLLGWISNHEVKTPTQNLTPLELRGRSWILKKINNKELFVSKADKGGATLILNYVDVKSAIETELYNTAKFEKISNNAEIHMQEVQKKTVNLVKNLGWKKQLTDEDKKLICGLNQNNNLMLDPEYKPDQPYVYPLFKIHKLSQVQIEEKKVPPNRLVHASKHGPMYRVEKWCSPYLSTISQSFCGDEFILDK